MRQPSGTRTSLSFHTRTRRGDDDNDDDGDLIEGQADEGEED